MADADEPTEEPRKNIHLDVPKSLHKELRMVATFLDMTLQDYGLEALKEKLAADQAKIAAAKQAKST